MNRFALFLGILLMLSAISLVTARYQARQLFISSERAAAKTQDLEVEWRRLQLERAELARNARVDEFARRDLEMVVPRPGSTIYLKDNKVVSGALAPAGRRP